GPTRPCADGNGCEPAHGRAITELAEEVVAPAIEVAGRTHATSVPVTDRDRDPVSVCPDRNGDVGPHRRPRAELAVAAIAPAKQLPAADATRARGPRGHTRPVGRGADLRRRRPTGGAAGTELAVRGPAPAAPLAR